MVSAIVAKSRQQGKGKCISSSPGERRLGCRLGALDRLVARQFMQEDVDLGEQGVLALLPLLHRLQRVRKRALRRSYGEFDSRFPEYRLQRDVLHPGEVFPPPGVVQGVTKEDHTPTHIPRRQ